MLCISSKVEGQSAMIISNKLNTTDQRASMAIMIMKFFDNTLSVIFSIFLGMFGVDRFYIRDYGLGITKLLLSLIAYAGIIIGAITSIPAVILISFLIYLLMGIWRIVDIFVCYKAVKAKNFIKIMEILEMYPEMDDNGRNQDDIPDFFSL